MSIKAAMMAHKRQYKCEYTFRRAKGPCSIEPIYLHTPEHIEALLLLFKIALQMVVLIERTVRQNIRERDRGLNGFIPNRGGVRNPRSEYLLKEFEDIVKGCRCLTAIRTDLYPNSTRCNATLCLFLRCHFNTMTTSTCSIQVEWGYSNKRKSWRHRNNHKTHFFKERN